MSVPWPARRCWPWQAVVSAMLLAGPVASAWGQGAEGRERLARMQDAAGKLNYRGTVVVSSAGVMSSSRVQSFSAGPQRFEMLELLDGRARQQYRHNQRIHVIWPQSRLAVVEQGQTPAALPLHAAVDERALENYELRLIGHDRVAGQEADVLLLKPRDGHRFAQRLWSDKGSGLLLRGDILGPGDEVLESSAFSDITIGGPAQPQAVLGPMHKLEGYRVVTPTLERTQLDAQGWTLARNVPGFRLISCLLRPLDDSQTDPRDPSVLQAVFSDGLTHVSVFIEAFDARRHKPMRTASGATHTQMQRQGDWWLTVMGDVPMGTVQLFAQALERRR